MMRYGLLLLAALAGTTPAWAQDRPLARPNRDVAVEYRSSGVPQGPMTGQGDLVTMRFNSRTSRIRMDGTGGRGYVILDTDAGRMTVVMTEQHMYMERPADPGMMAMFQARNTAFRKIGTETVAGVACTLYDVTVNDRTGQVCLTDDGVLLRTHGNDPGRDRSLEAVKVTYSEQPASLFEPPAGFQRMDMPNIPGGMPPGMGGPARGGMPGNPPGR
jgi:hypothetical protein